MDRTGGGGVRRIGWVLGVFVAACGGSASNGGRVSGASTSAQECTTSTTAPVPLGDLKYDARPNPPVNLLQNGDVEAGSGTTPAAWRVDASPAGATLTWDTARVVSGTHALLVTTMAPGRAAWAQDVSAVEAGLRYRLRANVFASAAGAGTHALEISWLDGSGNAVGHDALQSNVAGAWAEVDGFVTAPSTAAKATVAVSALTPGQYSFDDVMLVTEEPDPIAIGGRFPVGLWAPPAPGAIKNPGFTSLGVPGQPLAWQRSLQSGDATLTWDGVGALAIDASSNCDASWFQNVDVDPGVQYQLTATIFSTGTDGSDVVELTWLDPNGTALRTDAIAASATNTWVDVGSGALVPPATASTARVAFRVRRPGSYRLAHVGLDAVPGTLAIFDAVAAGINFTVDGGMGVQRAIPFETRDGPGAVDVTNASSLLSVARDSATALWFAGDELAWQPPQETAQAVAARYASVKAAGGAAAALPIWLNQAPRGTPDQPGNYALLQPYSAGADVVSMDLYPIPALGHAQLPNEGPWSVGQYTDIVRSMLASWNGAQRKVVWMVLQGHDWWEYRNAGAGHAIVVEWHDASGSTIRTDAVAADRNGTWRDVTIEGIIAPPGSVAAVVKAQATLKGKYSFDGISLRAQQGSTLITNGSPISFAEDSGGGETVVGTAAVQAGLRYTLAARILSETRPSLTQTRFMAWDAIIHGARGLTWWGIPYVIEGDAFMRELAMVTSELQSLSDDLLAPLSLQKILTSDSDLEAVLFKGHAGLLLSVANRTTTTISGVVGLDGLPLHSIERADGSAGCLHAAGNLVMDEFEPLQVRLYRIN